MFISAALLTVVLSAWLAHDLGDPAKFEAEDYAQYDEASDALVFAKRE